MNSIASGLVEPPRTIMPWLEKLKKADVGKYKEKFMFDALPVVKPPILYSPKPYITSQRRLSKDYY